MSTDAASSTRPDRAWLLVARREIAVKLHDRNFLISTGVLIVILIAVLGVQALLAGRTSSTTVAVASPAATQVVVQADGTAKAAGSDVAFKVKSYPTDAAVRTAVTAEKQSVGLVRSGDGWRLIGGSDRSAIVTTYVGAAAAQDVVRRNATAAGTSLAVLSKGSQVKYDLLNPSAQDRKGQARIGAFVFGFLFYLASLLLGIAIANSVVEEKQNRVVEILAAAIPIRQLLIGKVIGNTVIAVGQVALLSALGAVGLIATGNTSLLSDIAPGALWFLVFFLVGFVTLACLWAVVGALATRSEDIQASSMPVTALVMGIFFVGIIATGTVAMIASYVPLVSTIAMPVRVVAGEATWWQALLSLLISVVAAYGVIRVAERMYRGALLQTGSRSTYRQALAGLGSTRSKS